MLYESTKHGTNESSRHHPQKWRISFRIFPSELFKLQENFLYDLENEKENEFLAAVDHEAVNITDKVDKVTVEKAHRITEVNKHRFVNQTPQLSYNAHPSSYPFKAC